MRACLAPAVLEMAFLKAMWQSGAGNCPVTHPAAARGAHCSSSHTASVNHSSQPPASRHPQLPYVLVQGSRQSPSTSAGEPLGVPPSLPSQGAVPLPWPSTRNSTLPPSFQQPQVSWWGDRGASEGSLQLLLFLLLLDDMFFVSPVLSQLHQYRNCAQLPFTAGTCRQVQVSRLLAKLSIGKGEKWLKKCSQALVAVTVQDYLSPVFRSALCTGLSEQQQLLAVGVLSTQWSQTCLLRAVDSH